jgi:hypothetical protein
MKLLLAAVRLFLGEPDEVENYRAIVDGQTIDRGKKMEVELLMTIAAE